jgi:DNA polymerase sigma
MIVSFLQIKQNLAEHTGMKPSWNLGTLLIEFFHYYGVQFNYFHVGFAIHDGGKLFPKQDWYASSTSGVSTGYSSAGKSGNLGKPGLLCALNPDSPDLDMGKNSFIMGKIRRSFEHAYQLLTVAMNNPHQHSFLSYIIRADDPYLVGRIPLKR